MNQPRVSVVYECSDDIFDITVVSVSSLIANTSQMVDFYILDCGLNLSNKKIIKNICLKQGHSVHFIPIDLRTFSNLKGYTESNFVDCYSRLLIPSLLPDLDKAVYCDSDTIFIGDINDLWKIDIKDKAIAATYDLAWGNFKLLKLAQINNDFKFISAGIYIVNCKKWRKENISEKCFETAKKYRNELGAIIEDVFSLVFQNDDIFILPFIFCFTELPNRSRFLGGGHLINADYTQINLSDIVIVHFAGPNKPWRTRFKWNLLDQFEIMENVTHKKQIAFFDNFWNFAAMTPVYTSLFFKFISNQSKNICAEIETKILKIEDKDSVKMQKLKKKIKLFNFLPILKIVYHMSNVRVYLFGFIPLLKIASKNS